MYGTPALCVTIQPHSYTSSQSFRVNMAKGSSGENGSNRVSKGRVWEAMCVFTLP